MNEFQQTMNEYELKPTKQIERLACQSCGEIAIPGLNTRVNIIQKNRREKKKMKKQTKNLVESTCLTCGRVKIFHGSFKNKMKTKPSSAPTIPVITSLTDKIPNKTTQTVVKVEEINKKKKNKGKNNNLKALLAKQQTNNSSNNGSLGDFLSGL
jgi:RNase P subunit RPR2